jgi:hypothetical protein
MPNDSPWVPKHGPRPVGQQLCAYTPTGQEPDYCHAPATWHVMWDGDLDNSFTCDQHMDLIQRRWMYDDRHPVVADCGMPGALWMYKLNRCEFPNAPSQAGAERQDVTA